MKLLVAVVADQAAERAARALVAAGYPGPTRINTVGGFLRRGNVTLLLGTDDERVEDAVDVLRHALDAIPPAEGQHRATLFVLDAAQLLRF